MKNPFTRWFASGWLICSCVLFGEEYMDDMSLALPMEEPERLVSMTGELRLQILDQDPEHPELGAFDWWILQLDSDSFKKVCTTPVHAAFYDPEWIRNAERNHDLGLTGDYDRDWLDANIGRKVTLQGYLWHAHTAHHHSLVLLDTNAWQ